MAWLLLGIYGLLIAPVRLGALARWKDGEMRLALGVMLWGARAVARFRSGRDKKGALCLRGEWLGREVELHPRLPGRGQGLGRILGGGNGFRRLGGLVRFTALEAEICPGGPDAAGTALWAGLIRIIAVFFPRLRVRCRPAFNGKTSAVFRCIADTRLGIIIAVCLFGRLKSLRTGRKEEKKWIVPSRI